MAATGDYALWAWLAPGVSFLLLSLVVPLRRSGRPAAWLSIVLSAGALAGAVLAWRATVPDMARRILWEWIPVEDGVLTSWFLDSATARELGLVTTGHAQRGVSSTPSPGPSNLHLSAGTVTPDALMADITDGFYVTDLIGMGVNQVTGDYSRGASGFWIENGKRTYPVSEVTIAGNLIDLFKALSPANDLEFRFGTNAPTVRVEGLTVGGL